MLTSQGLPIQRSSPLILDLLGNCEGHAECNVVGGSYLLLCLLVGLGLTLIETHTVLIHIYYIQPNNSRLYSAINLFRAEPAIFMNSVFVNKNFLIVHTGYVL